MAEKVYLKVDVDTKEAEKNVDDLNDGLNETKTGVGDVANAADSMTGGFIGKFKGVLSSVKKGIGAFKSLRVAIAATGLGALVIAIGAVITAFKSSEEGQNKFAKLMGIIGAVTGNFVDLIADLGENIISAFENPKEAISSFANMLKENIVNRFEGLVKLVPRLGEAIGLLFQGKFKKAGKVATDAVGQVVLGVENVTDKVKDATAAVGEFIQENIKEAEVAANIADMRAKADKAERQLILDRAKADRERAELLDKAVDKENYTAEQRIAFLEEAAAIEEAITQQEIEAARLRFEAKRQENELSKSTKEDKDEEAQLEARLIELETARLRKQKAVTAQLSGVRREAQAERDAEAAEEEKKPFMKIRKKIGENRMERFEDDLNEYGDIYRSAVDAAISKETGTKGVEGFDVAENLNYSTQGLLDNFPGKLKKAGYGTDAGYDTLRIENELTRNPRAIGDAMYGPVGGYDFRGRGYLQITGKDNYRKVSRDLFGDDRLLENPDLIMANEEIARKAAISYLGMKEKGTLKRMRNWGLIDRGQEVSDLNQEDANLFVLMQVSGGGWNPTVLKGLKRMDEQTGVVRDYDALDARIKAGKSGKNK